MKELTTRPPRTIMEVYKMLPEGTLAELIDGIIYMSPSPFRNHQRIVSLLSSKMVQYAEEKKLGEVYVAPFDVYLDNHANAVQPDIVFVCTERLSIIQNHIHGSPDLVIEILSEGTKQDDLTRKKNLYERFAIKEFWMIDAETKEAVGFELMSGKYSEFARSIGKVSSRMLQYTFHF